MFKTLLKSPFLLLVIIANFVLVGCGDQPQSSGEQAVDQAEETAEQATDQVEEAVEETTTQD